MPPNISPPSGSSDPNRPDLLRWAENKGASWAFNKFAAGAIVNWKTSLAGIAAILSGLAALITYLIDAAQSGHFDIEHIERSIGLIVVGGGLLHARDADKSSEQQPAIPKAIPVDQSS